MKDELGGKIMIKFFEFRAKTYSYLRDDSNEDNKAKGTKKCVKKRKLKFEDYKNCLEATQTENKTKYLEENKTDKDNIKEFIKNNKSIKKTQQRFNRERQNVFTEEINKTVLSSNDNKRMQSIDWI